MFVYEYAVYMSKLPGRLDHILQQTSLTGLKEIYGEKFRQDPLAAVLVLRLYKEITKDVCHLTIKRYRGNVNSLTFTFNVV